MEGASRCQNRLVTATRPEPAILTGDYIRLEPAEDHHLPALFEAIAQPAVFEYGFGGGLAAHIGWTGYDLRVWGTAVNPEAKLLLLQCAFDAGFGRVRIQTDVLNEHSKAAIAKLGATFEGVVRREQPRADGTWRDTAMFSVVIEEWPRVRAGLQARLTDFGGRPVLFRTPRA